MQFSLYKPVLVQGTILMSNCQELDGGEWVKIADVRDALKPSTNTPSRAIELLEICVANMTGEKRLSCEDQEQLIADIGSYCDSVQQQV